jgi:hypothetical protein
MFSVNDVISKASLLFGQVVTVRGFLVNVKVKCWLSPCFDWPKERDSSILLDRPGLHADLLQQVAPFVGGVCWHCHLAIVTGTVFRVDNHDFHVGIRDITFIEVEGHENKRYVICGSRGGQSY